MRVWVNVWGKVTLRRFVTIVFAPLLCGCIDDFDDPKGYGPRDGTSGTYGKSGYTCSDLCERNSMCDDGGSMLGCRRQCEDIATTSQRAGCSEELDMVFDCLANLSNVCSQTDVCYNEANRLSDCLAPYCAIDPAACEF